MSNKIHEIQGYAIVAGKVVFVTRLFKAKDEEGYQFNIAFSGDMRISPRFPTRHEADLERELLLKAIREA
jgi:hypothetical protein